MEPGTASVRASNELGAGNPKSAAFSVVVMTVLSLIISLTIAIMILVFRNVINYALTAGEAVANAGSELTPLLTVTLILNGVQPVLSKFLTVALICPVAYLSHIRTGIAQFAARGVNC